MGWDAVNNSPRGKLRRMLGGQAIKPDPAKALAKPSAPPPDPEQRFKVSGKGAPYAITRPNGQVIGNAVGVKRRLKAKSPSVDEAQAMIRGASPGSSRGPTASTVVPKAKPASGGLAARGAAPSAKGKPKPKPFRRG